MNLPPPSPPPWRPWGSPRRREGRTRRELSLELHSTGRVFPQESGVSPQWSARDSKSRTGVLLRLGGISTWFRPSLDPTFAYVGVLRGATAGLYPGCWFGLITPADLPYLSTKVAADGYSLGGAALGARELVAARGRAPSAGACLRGSVPCL